MERFYANVCPFQAALEKRPKVLQSIGVNLAVNVSLCVIYDAVGEMFWQSDIGHKVIGIDGASGLDMLVNFTLKHGPFAIRHYGGSDFAFTVEQSENFGFAANP